MGPSSLSSRIFALVAAVALLGMGGLSLLVVRLHTADLEAATVRGGRQLSETLVRSTRLGMLQNRKADVYGALQGAGVQEGIERIRIYNKEGHVVFSTVPQERGAVVDTRAEACTRCHLSGAEPVVRPAEGELSRFFDGDDGERVLGMITPVYNEAACAAAGCHPDPSQQNILGVIDLQLSLAGVDAAAAQGNRRFLLIIGSLMLALGTVASWFVWRWVHVPVKELIRGTERIRAGQLDQRILLPGGGESLRAPSEIDRLASSFNEMSTELEQAHRQLTEWARTLEARVEEKSAHLQQAQSRLVHNEKMASLGALSAVVAHEINNPLSGVLTYARLVRRRLEKGDAEIEPLLERLQTIERETARCGNIVRNLLEFSRQSGIAAVPTNLNDVLERTLGLIGHKLDLQGVRLHRRLAGDLPEVTCDAEQIQQALLALLMNAVEAMPEGGELEVATHTGADERADWVAVEIVDAGPGIADEILPQIFEPFFTTKQDKHGVGLGLSVVHGIVRRHSGEIDVDSQPGRTRFVLWLPPGGLVDVEPQLREAAGREVAA
jgi:two-component system NtrC family sensor kinase